MLLFARLLLLRCCCGAAAAAPLLLGYVLGPLIEENFRRALLISRGDFMVFVERPISATSLVMSVLLVIWVAMGSRTTATSAQEN